MFNNSNKSNVFVKAFTETINCVVNTYIKLLNWLSKKIAEVIKKIMR